MKSYWIISALFLINSINSISAQFSAYDQTVIPFSIYNTDGNPNNIITNSKCICFFLFQLNSFDNFIFDEKINEFQ